jgi:endonuclease/exonuclease/phosphatase family metal-dependent hydrolase
MKKILFLLSLAMFMVACTPNDEPTSPTGPTSKYKKHAGDGEIKIMSFNLRTSGMDKGTANHWDNRKAACVALIRDHMPDIMGVQEATYTDQWVWLKNQLKSVGYDGYGVNRQTGKESGAGECPGILYNTNVIKKLDVGTFWLSETPDTPSKGWDANYYRTATWGLFEHIPTGTKFFFVNTHLDHESVTAQVEGMKLITEKLKDYKDDYPVYLTGDFNVLATDKAMDAIKGFMRNARMYAYPTDSYGTTNGFNTSSAKKTIDHIYYRSDLKPIEYYTIREAYEGVTYVSDHYPIYAIIKLKK